MIGESQLATENLKNITTQATQATYVYTDATDGLIAKVNNLQQVFDTK